MQAEEGAGRTGSQPGRWSARLSELSAAGGRTPASRAPCCCRRRHLSRRHFRNRATWSGRAAREGQREPRERLAGGGCGGSPSPPPAPRSCVRGTEPTRRARGPAAPAATATAVESCDNQAARARAAALAQAQPLPCRPSQASSETVTSEPGLVGTRRGGWGRCELVAVQVFRDCHVASGCREKPDENCL